MEVNMESRMREELKNGRIISIIMVVLFVLLNLGIFDTQEESNSTPIETVSYSVPKYDGVFQIQFADYPVKTNINVDTFDVDLFETSVETIEELHSIDKYVMCYINVGAWEEYRPDADDFPKEVIGNDYVGWEGEKWLDISNFELFSHIIESRFDLAKEKGCDGIEPDNIQSYEEDTGIDITLEDQERYNKWLSYMAHDRGLAIGLKNAAELVPALVDDYDWAIIEDCSQWGFCSDFAPFVEKDKPVYQIEYTDTKAKNLSFCEESKKNGYIGILKNRELDSWVKYCY